MTDMTSPLQRDRPVTQPVRIQLSRAKGWRKPENTVVVSRPSKWGNPYSVSEFGAPLAVSNYRAWISGMISIGARDISELAGKNLACWCRLGTPCHADVLLELANKLNHAKPLPSLQDKDNA